MVQGTHSFVVANFGRGQGACRWDSSAPVSGSRRLLAPTAVGQKVKKGDQVFQIPGLYTQPSLNIPLQQHKGEQ